MDQPDNLPDHTTKIMVVVSIFCVILMVCTFFSYFIVVEGQSALRLQLGQVVLDKNNIAEIVVKNDLDGEVMRGTAIYATDNMFMTNAHVVKGGSQAIVLVGNERYNVVSAELSRNQDLAFVSIDTKIILHNKRFLINMRF